MEIIGGRYTSVADASSDGSKHGLDVTDKLKSMLTDSEQKHTIVIPAGTTLNGLFGDPEPFHPKVLIVKYMHGGEEHTQRILEVNNRERVIGGNSTTSKEKPKMLVISKATYGLDRTDIKDCQVDVLEKLQNMVDGETDTLTIAAKIKFNEFFGGDPAPFAKKFLIIDYTVNGENRNEKISEERKEEVIIGDERQYPADASPASAPCLA